MPPARPAATLRGMGGRLALLVVAATVTLAACGDSAEDTAQEQVCTARADIERQIDELQSLTPATVDLETLQQSFTAIGEDLDAIADAEGDLSDERREEAQQAVETFGAAVGQIASDALAALGTGDLSAAQLERQVREASQQLAAGFERAFAPVDC